MTTTTGISCSKKEQRQAQQQILPAAPRSQTQVQERFAHLLRKHAAIFRKAQTSYIRQAKKGEHIETVIGGVTETSNIANDDRSWIVCGKAAGEQYILTEADFNASYEASSAKPIQPTTTALRSLHDKGFQEYQSKRSVYAHVVDLEDMAWFQSRVEDGAELSVSSSDPALSEPEDVAYFMAPWGEAMRVEPGDLLVMQYPSSGKNHINEEIYRIEKTVFPESYNPVLPFPTAASPGHQQCGGANKKQAATAA